MLRAVLCLLAVAACGRVGFDEVAPGEGGPIEPRDLTIATASTTSTTFTSIPGATIVVPPAPTTTWVLFASATLHSTALDRDAAEIRYLVDGVERGIGGTQNHELGKGGPWQHVYAFAGATTPSTITFELRDADGATTTVEQLHVVVVPLATADVFYASADAPQATTTVTPAPLVVLDASIVPAAYVFLALASSREDTGSDIYVEWTGPDGTVRLREAQNSRGSWQSVLAAWFEPIATPTATFTLSTRVTSGANLVRDVRIVGLRADAFASVELRLAPGPTMTSSSVPVTLDELVPNGIATRYVYLASSRVDDDACAAPQFPERRSLYLIDDVAYQTASYVISNCAFEATNGTVGLLSARPARLVNQAASGNGLPVNALDSTILLLGLP